MAARYWIGGTGTWDSTNTTNWSTASGGSGGASVPVANDTVFFDTNSGTGTVTFTNAGVSLGTTTISSANITLSLGAAFTGSISISAGTFTTNNYNHTGGGLTLSSATATANLGSSTCTYSGSTPVNITGTFNAGTSNINLSSNLASITAVGKTFYNMTWTSTSLAIPGNFPIAGNNNVFNNITVTGRNASGVSNFFITSGTTVNGTFTVTAGTATGTGRTFIAAGSGTGTVRTFSVGGFSGTDVDFRDMAFTGAGAPISGTRLGDAKGNSGITFDAPKTVYCRSTGSANWGSSTGWSATNGGAADATQFPLAQDTAVFPSATYPASGSTITINAAYNIGAIDMSARTSNTMTLATGTNAPFIYGNWINGTGITLSGTGIITFAGQGSQTITSAGKSFTGGVTINSAGGSVTLADAFSSTYTGTSLNLTNGTFDAATYNVTLSGTFNSSNSNTRTLAIGSGTWSIAGSGASAWTTASSTGLTVTGSGTITLTSASAKTFAGGGVAYTNITVNQGGAGALTFTGSNTFKDITNTYSATGATTITFTSGTTTTLTQFTATGASGKVLTIGASTTSQATLFKPTTWYMGANSTNGGNNTGLVFTAGGGIDYISVSYINGTIPSTGNFLMMFK